MAGNIRELSSASRVLETATREVDEFSAALSTALGGLTFPKAHAGLVERAGDASSVPLKASFEIDSMKPPNICFRDKFTAQSVQVAVVDHVACKVGIKLNGRSAHFGETNEKYESNQIGRLIDDIGVANAERVVEAYEKFVSNLKEAKVGNLTQRVQDSFDSLGG
jgi:hypothetical protein